MKLFLTAHICIVQVYEEELGQMKITLDVVGEFVSAPNSNCSHVSRGKLLY